MLFFKSKRKERYERTVKAALRGYFDKLAPQYLTQLQITDIQVHIRKNTIETIITLCKPGLLIGMEGKIIDDVTKHIQRRVEKPFRITIKESTLWQ